MLNITFNIHTGQWSPIPNDTHYISIVGYKKLTTNQQYLLRNYIVKHHLDISLKEATHHHHHFSVQKSLKNYNYLYQKVKPCDLDPWICSIAGYSSYSCSPYLFMCPIIFQIGYSNIMFHDGLRYFHNLMSVSYTHLTLPTKA